MPKALSIPNLSSLRPFRSFLFLKLAENQSADDRVMHLRNAIADLIPTLRGAGESTISARSKMGDVYSALAVYIRERRAPWSLDPALLDTEHHLVAVSGYRTWCAVFMSDSGLREAVRIEIAEESAGFEDFELVPTKKLNAIFVKGRARTLWLNHVQRRSSLKADHKVLSGVSLQDALDPLNDQAYAFTAARCENDLVGVRSTYGVAPRKSRLWFKRSKNWADYTNTVATLLRALDESTAEEDAPLPVLSIPILTAVDPTTLGDAYEMSLLPLELRSPADDNEHSHDEADDIPDLSFEVLAAAVPTLRAAVATAEGHPLGQFDFELQIDTSGRAHWAITAVAEADPDMLALLRRFSHRLNVSFGRGFAVSGGAIYAVRYRDLPFNGFRWEEFGSTDILREKPNPLTPQTIGNQGSLFCWLKNGWTNGNGILPPGGWLASNDGALEMADFVHLQADVPATLTLVHVKAAQNDSPDRGIAVGPYELIVSQAIKNLRHIDPQLTTTEFMNRLGYQIRDAVWHEGVLANRDDMLAAIQAHGANLSRRVIIIQPHTRQRAHANALTSPEGSRERHLVRQLNSLLLAAQQNCTSVGAEFVVVAQQA